MRLKEAYNSLVDKHYIFNESGDTYILRRCNNKLIEVDDARKKIKVYTKDGEVLNYSYDFIEEFKVNQISEEYEENLLTLGAKEIK